MHINTQKWIMWLAIIVTVETAIGNGAVHLTNMIPANWVPFVVGWCSFLAFVGSTIIATVTGASVYSQSQGIPPAIKAAILLAALTLGALFATTPGHAAVRSQLLSAPSATSPRAASSLSDLLNQMAAKGIVDLQAADAAASALDDKNVMADEIAHVCYVALIRFVGSLPPAAADGSMPGPALLFERARLARMLVQKGLPTYLKIGCAPLIQDEANLFIKLGALIGVAVNPALFPAIPLLP